MKDPRMMLSEEVSNPKSRKKKPANHVTPMFQLKGENLKGAQSTLPPSLKTSKKAVKRSLNPEASPPSLQQPERSTSDSLPDSSRDGDDYRALRRKYLMLEDESFVLGKELVEVEDEVKILEDEKLALLDQLVVLEGLVDPSEIQSHRPPTV
ncbi:hypothetical protein AQUCO_00700970v1 [Aquilegia coerulea]|uniref:Uncharacterized protein n=1 Tax=Aquilegia coerulea TaxID=218851 RepID=A0A2G5EMH5_AQUCA|nr:hypothetical protein AQUCO_00700970v1 [Aquilegia coerulea]PIA56968.1 hypothetical protein AQUCO_00700970v1 [Aquilegia coerulea]